MSNYRDQTSQYFLLWAGSDLSTLHPVILTTLERQWQQLVINGTRMQIQGSPSLEPKVFTP